ncbi:hypothetical protein H310_02418 [Aphanomyces invadans]|uniref:Uncharacterized protein n=1 Tax=Aphanomyces invadans TaxID=157072 RepID=A0A024UP20_9STRA|nr:hypothetical protein H310_02418 [Aphanomyces invadans]ETW08049.1 hypothetical protein H310_02418 [Aphanomyces invadans]|eukprot:XP_008864142.1 hypothetical protein H310_02418 [Aphanomyces invadans]
MVVVCEGPYLCSEPPKEHAECDVLQGFRGSRGVDVADYPLFVPQQCLHFVEALEQLCTVHCHVMLSGELARTVVDRSHTVIGGCDISCVAAQLSFLGQQLMFQPIASSHGTKKLSDPRCKLEPLGSRGDGGKPTTGS